MKKMRKITVLLIVIFLMLASGFDYVAEEYENYYNYQYLEELDNNDDPYGGIINYEAYDKKLLEATYEAVMPLADVTVIHNDWSLISATVAFTIAPAEILWIVTGDTPTTSGFFWPPNAIVIPNGITLTIVSQGSETFSITQDIANQRHFIVANGATLNLHNVRLTRDDQASTALSGGVNVNAGGTLNLHQGSEIVGNRWNNGGAVSVVSGALNMNGGTINNNQAILNGGGIYTNGSMSININSGAITNNTAGLNGGGIYIPIANLNNLTVGSEVVFNGNSAATLYNNVRPANQVIHNTNILTTARSVPTTFAYNNFDIHYSYYVARTLVTKQYFSLCGDPSLDNMPIGVFTFISGSNVNVSSLIPVRTGYTFSHWEAVVVVGLISPMSAVNKVPSQGFVIEANWHLYAQWVPNQVIVPPFTPPPTSSECVSCNMAIYIGLFLLSGTTFIFVKKKLIKN